RAADGRALGVVGTRDTRSGAVLRDVADAGGGAAQGPAGREGVRRTAVAHAVAALAHVAEAGRRATDRRALGVVRADRARSGAGLGDVADAGGRATRGARGDEAIGGTVVADAVAALGHVADAGRRAADGRALRVGRARRARSGAGLLDVAHPCRGATDGAGSLDRAGGGTAVAVHQVAVVACLGGLGDAVAADGGREGRDGRRPVLRRVDRPVGEVAAGCGHDAVFGVDRDVRI